MAKCGLQRCRSDDAAESVPHEQVIGGQFRFNGAAAMTLRKEAKLVAAVAAVDASTVPQR